MAKRKFRNEQSEEIRELYATGRYSQRDLASLLGVSPMVINRIVSNSFKPELSDEERFMAKVDITAGDDSCWEWIAGKSESGYGKFRLNGKKVFAHRYAYELSTGTKIPKGMHVCHSCDNPSCLNPKHLSVGTPAENTRQMIERDRKYMGGSKTKLNEVQALEMKFYADLGITHYTIGKFMGVNGSTLQKYLKKDPFELQRQWLKREREGRRSS